MRFVTLDKIIKEMRLEVLHLPTDASEIKISRSDVTRPGLQLAGFFVHAIHCCVHQLVPIFLRKIIAQNVDVQISVAGVPERFYPNSDFLLQLVNEFDEIIYAVARDDNINFVHHGCAGFDRLQKCAARFPDGSAAFLGVGDEQIDCALVETNFGDVIAVF